MLWCERGVPPTWDTQHYLAFFRGDNFWVAILCPQKCVIAKSILLDKAMDVLMPWTPSLMSLDSLKLLGSHGRRLQLRSGICQIEKVFGYAWKI
jgi:hypothetical protein